MDNLESFLLQLEPILALSPRRLKELAGLCFIERVNQDIDPLRMNVLKSAQVLYLLKGDIGLRYVDGSKKILRGGSEAAKYPVGSGSLPVQDTIALTEIQIVRIDTDLLDIMMTWDQLAGYENTAPPALAAVSHDSGKWMKDTEVFSVSKLQNGLFSRLPPAHIEEMFRRMEPMPVRAGQVIIRQGEEGDYYYLIENGMALVSRRPVPSQPDMLIAQLEAGSAFGEEALVSNNRRNATVSMKTDGMLLRLSKQDFIELLQEPLLTKVSVPEAEYMVKDGAVWLDVRLPTEYDYQHLPGAINAPLHELRNLVGKLNKAIPYIAYCHTGRRSSAAAIILLGYGFNVRILNKSLGAVHIT
ncbi:cyclic nucleotide-binding domain-containing protein [Methylobacillus gramineus]|uniref:cyclic nucleotide-binding domain-containing protein n=1 Tax=Methylobacillus gramineus TaxID=755169 RepID=UPI001CFF6848|nr:cyclic nucleotide-binding domain-containing protein [Methylobacillus gramineus]MCB5186344.1 cyclic nucleotide-binding domain-containing protein [Methylobacillus gramineus]